ncbi:hypothetical protein BS47DRAFT_743785 [Hydnum rufescens UP504]|uniref:Uncharacterized protein n=1 Tax=Hydnum rufescens UP504 TaxID=1448309 RepID=A0A9P6B1G2_9AGAM|nr:hypothetical protein BS47DRAFT_743785 [Hydnum rufescens UP504]
MGCSPSRLGLSPRQVEGNGKMRLDSANRSRTPPINSGSSHPQNAPNPSIHDSDYAKIGQRYHTSSRYPAPSLLIESIQSAPPVIQMNFEDVSSHPGGLERPWHPGLDPDLIAVSPRTDLNDGAPHHPAHRSHSLPSSSINFSSLSVQSNLFTHSWHRPSSMALIDLASYIHASANAHVILLKWCKDLKGVPTISYS